jgi:hypothetical protein
VPSRFASEWVSFRYRDFYDIPRAILVEYADAVYFFDCPFDRDLEEYGDAYNVYRVPEGLRGDIDSISWEGLSRRLSFVGSVAIDAVEFDSTKRRWMDARVFEHLRTL